MDNAVIPSSAVPVSVLARMSARTKGMLVLGLAALAAVIAATWLWNATPTYRVLFTNLSDRDGGAIIAQLAQMNIPYKSADGGTLLVPQEKVHEARLKLASAGLPKGSGFLRDKQPPTASVLIQLHNGKLLDRAQVAGIVHLVSSSVPELNPKNVSVVDQAGNLLASEQA